MNKKEQTTKLSLKEIKLLEEEYHLEKWTIVDKLYGNLQKLLSYIEINSNLEVNINKKTGEINFYKISTDENEKSLKTEWEVPKGIDKVISIILERIIRDLKREYENKENSDYYHAKVGDLVSGKIVKNDKGDGAFTINLYKGINAFLPQYEMAPTDVFEIGDTVQAVVLHVANTPTTPIITLSRTHPMFLQKLLEREVPEIYDGVVEVKAIVREAGARAKIAIASTVTSVNPVGAVLGINCSRINSIIKQANNEKIDLVKWSSDPKDYIISALAPSKPIDIKINSLETRYATVIVPNYQMSLAIGKDGQNARLAARLTGWKLDIKSQESIFDQ